MKTRGLSGPQWMVIGIVIVLLVGAIALTLGVVLQDSNIPSSESSPEQPQQEAPQP